jgi:spore coat polysaccharide biosynthesis protein SpsF
MDDGRPTIKSHLGFWGEVISQKALIKARNMTSDELYLQHPTNFLYANPDLFNIELIAAPDGLGACNGIRLTLDTEADYTMLRQLYAMIVERGIPHAPNSIIDFIDHNLFYKKQMKKQINANAK